MSRTFNSHLKWNRRLNLRLKWTLNLTEIS